MLDIDNLEVVDALEDAHRHVVAGGRRGKRRSPHSARPRRCRPRHRAREAVRRRVAVGSPATQSRTSQAAARARRQGTPAPHRRPDSRQRRRGGSQRRPARRRRSTRPAAPHRQRRPGAEVAPRPTTQGGHLPSAHTSQSGPDRSLRSLRGDPRPRRRPRAFRASPLPSVRPGDTRCSRRRRRDVRGRSRAESSAFDPSVRARSRRGSARRTATAHPHRGAGGGWRPGRDGRRRQSPARAEPPGSREQVSARGKPCDESIDVLVGVVEVRRNAEIVVSRRDDDLLRRELGNESGDVG